MSEQIYRIATEKWVEDVVIGLNLCPFAKREWVKNRVRIHVSLDTDTESLLTTLQLELSLLEANSDIETTLLVHPEVLQDFYDYNDFLSLADDLLEQMDLDGIYQVASFHPDYQFGGAAPDDAENYTNRSPFPMLHLIREDSLEKAIENYPNVAAIPENNIALMNKMGSAQMQALLAACFVVPDALKTNP